MRTVLRQDDQFRCCMYLHVHTGTIILGVLHIVLQLVVVSTLLISALKHDVALKSPFSPETSADCEIRSHSPDIFYMLMHVVPGFTIFHQSHADFSWRFRGGNLSQYTLPDSQDPLKDNSLFSVMMDDTVGSGVSDKGVENVELNDSPKVEDSSANQGESSRNRPPVNIKKSVCYDRRTNTYFSLCLALISLGFGYLLVHGAISRQPAHLLPFLCLQVFDFVVALICMLGYMSSASDISHWLRFKIANQEGMSASAVHLNSRSVSLILISTSCLILAFKAYCIGIVWDCHRFILLTNRHGGLLFPDASGAAPRFAFLGPLFGRLASPPFMARRSAGGGGRGSAGGDNGMPDITTVDTSGAGVFVDIVPAEPPKESALPKYEEALSIPANAFAPPPYFAPKSSNAAETKVTIPSTTPAEQSTASATEDAASGSATSSLGDVAVVTTTTSPEDGKRDPSAGPRIV